jgi:hypothetical protein
MVLWIGYSNQKFVFNLRGMMILKINPISAHSQSFEKIY